MDMIILKLGGSVITDKSKECFFKKKVVDNLSKEIKRANKEIILIHGAGSFGHIQAEKFKLNKGYVNKNQLHGFSVTQERVQRLNTLVLKSLQDNGIPAVSISPHSVLKLDNHKLADINYKIFEEYLENHFTPVTFGDVVLDKKLRFSICSGDLLSIALTKHFKPKRVIYVIDVDGLYTSNPKINKNAKLIESSTIEQLENFTTSLDSHADVTGGMGGKLDAVKTITKLGINTILVNGNKPDRLYNVLVEENARSTIIYGGRNEKN